jgi:hypothetical protein
VFPAFSETPTGPSSPGRAHFSAVVARPQEKGAGIGVWKTISRNKRKETELKHCTATRQSHCWLTVMVVVCQEDKGMKYRWLEKNH